MKSLLRKLDLDRFDLLVIAVIAGLIAAIGGVVLAGDQVGVTIVDRGYAPVGTASGAKPVRVRFSEEMDRASVERNFHITPDTPGTLAWSARHTLTFTPAQPLIAGQSYTVTIGREARAALRSVSLEDDFSWSFTVRAPRAVYLAPSDAIESNLLMTDPATGDVFQLTSEPEGIMDFAVSPNGSQIAYSRNNEDGTADIWVLDLLYNTQRQITNCADGICANPDWKPDGAQLAYQYQRFDTALGSGVNPSRAWIVDLQSLETGLLFADAQILGQDPTWSPDGSRVAVVDASIPGIRIHNFDDNTDLVIESMQGMVGAFAPDGSALVYPDLVRGALGQTFYSQLRLADFAAESERLLDETDDNPVEDNAAAWSPDGTQLVITRRYLGDGFTRGQQIYRYDLATGEATPLVVDPDYHHSVPQWDAAGQRIVFQRFSLVDAGARPEVWSLDLATGDLTQLAENAFFPAWLP